MVDIARARAKVLIFDSDLARAHELGDRLRFLNYEPWIADDPDKSNEMTKDPPIAVMLGNIARSDIREAFHEMAVRRPDLPVLLFDVDSADADLSADLANRPIWTLDAPIRRSQLARLLRRAERYNSGERRQRITGNSRPIRRVRQLIEQVAEYDTNVLITGESGSRGACREGRRR